MVNAGYVVWSGGLSLSSLYAFGVRPGRVSRLGRASMRGAELAMRLRWLCRQRYRDLAQPIGARGSPHSPETLAPVAHGG